MTIFLPHAERVGEYPKGEGVVAARWESYGIRYPLAPWALSQRFWPEF
jgi:hypothetical protein